MPAERFRAMEARLNGFKEAYGTVCFLSSFTRFLLLYSSVAVAIIHTITPGWGGTSAGREKGEKNDQKIKTNTK